MRERDWYFQGWERRQDASGKTALVYTGEYYALPEGAKRPKAVCTALAAALLGLYLAAALLPTKGGMWRVAAIPQLLELIPLIYLAMGVVCLLCAPKKMTFRSWYASWRRIGRAARWSAVFTALMAAAQIVFLLSGAAASAVKESLYLTAELGCAALSIALGRFIRKHPCPQSMDGGQDKE